ncbi:MAG: AAA family ATPase [Candidatus Omnitrophica bacterium]|nr:AAA family ATPase [Candidatus Omnitrophota bacterium]
MAQYELNFSDYLRIFRKQRVVIVMTFVAVILISIIYVSLQPVFYQASAVIKIEERKTIAGLLTEWILYNPADIMESHLKAIKSYDVLKDVALRINLIDKNSDSEEISKAIAQLEASITTERVGNSNMIRITASADTAQEAMLLAKAVSEAYEQYNLAEKNKQFRQARQFIEEQLASLEERLRQSEERLKEFGEEVKNIKLAEPIEKKMVELQFELADALRKYTEKHPRVKQLRSQIEEMEKQMSGFSGQQLEYARLNREVEVSRKLYAMLKEKLEEARITEAERVGDVAIVNPAVLPTSSVSVNKQTGILIGAILGIILGIGFAFLKENLDTSIGTIQDVESLLKLPVVGVIPSIEEESEKKSKPFQRIKETLIPKKRSDTEKRKVGLIAHYKPTSSAAESFRNIYVNLKLDASKKTVLITSSCPSEGKTCLVSNLGIVIAQSGLKTVLVSTDLRRPNLAKIFGIKKTPGLSEYIMATAGLEEILKGFTDIILGEIGFAEISKTPGIENIWIIPSGQIPLNPVEFLESERLEMLIEQLRFKFEVILFDSPPVLAVTDASILASKVDSTLIVYEIGRTSRDALLRTKAQLESAGAKITGIVLNNIRPQTEALTSYPYYYYKYKYYGKESEEKDT